MRRILIAIAIWLSGSVANGSAADRVNFSYSSLSGSQSPLWIAKEEGFFKKHNVDLQFLYIVGGRVVVQAMLANEVQFGVSGPGAVIRANLSGADLVYVAVNANVADFVLVTPNTTKDIQQLRGKRIGIGQLGGGPDYTTRIVLEKHGLAPDKDVRIVQLLTGQPGRLAALESGAVESVVINPPLTLQARQMGFNLLLDYATVLPHFFSSGFITARKYVQKNPETVQNVVKALLDATRYLVSNEEGTIRTLAKYFKINDRALLQTYYREVIVKQINRSLYPDLRAVEFVIENERKATPAMAKVRPEDFVDTRFLDRLKSEGY